MYVCSCNGLTDHDVRDAVGNGATRPGEVYAHCQCRAQCGNCVPTVLCLLRQAIAAAQATPRTSAWRPEALRAKI